MLDMDMDEEEAHYNAMIIFTTTKHSNLVVNFHGAS